jgi:Golgi nucleoside diphosphatase
MQIPVSKHESTVLFLKATAGMRLLSPDKQEVIMTNVQDYLSNTTNSPFYYKREWATIISGVQEGVFGWISVNYLLHDLEAPNHATVGALGNFY